MASLAVTTAPPNTVFGNPGRLNYLDCRPTNYVGMACITCLAADNIGISTLSGDSQLQCIRTMEVCNRAQSIEGIADATVSGLYYLYLTSATHPVDQIK